MRDGMNKFHPVQAIAPAAAVADNTPFVSQIIDRRGFEMLTFVIQLGALVDADATFVVLVEDGDIANLSDASAVIDDQLVGTELLAGFRFDDDNEPRKIGYIGDKRYVRLTITPANNTGNVFLSATAILGCAGLQPTANPPV